MAENAAAEGNDSEGNPPEGKSPERKCLISGAVLPKERLIRFVVGPDDVVTPDIEGKLPGRGMWLSASRDVINRACAKNAFARAARKKVVIPGNLAETVETLLTGRCLNLLGLARRSGDVVAGFEKVRSLLSKQEAGLLLAACDGAEDGRKKIKAWARTAPLVTLFTSDQLGGAIGRETAVHVVVVPGKMAKRLLSLCEKLNGFRGEAEK